MVVSTRTRFGRAVKKPTLYVPVETVLDDDYATDEHDDTDSESLIDTEDEYKTDDESDDDEDADENGNLKDFVVDDDEASESESEEE